MHCEVLRLARGGQDSENSRHRTGFRGGTASTVPQSAQNLQGNPGAVRAFLASI